MHIYNEQKLSDADLEMGNSLLALAMHEKTIVSYCSVETAALQCCLYSRNIVRLTQGFLSCVCTLHTASNYSHDYSIGTTTSYIYIYVRIRA